MKYTLMMGAIALAFGLAMIANAVEPDVAQSAVSAPKQKPLVTEAQEHDTASDSADIQPQAPSPKCKLYQNSTRKHLRAHDTVGNPDRLNCK